MPGAKSDKPLGCGGFFLIILGLVVVVSLLFWGCVAATSNSRDDESFNGVRYPDREAIAGCESLVGNQLRSPSSADYSSTVTRSGDEWTVIGHVDSANAFGTQVRTDYTCTVTFPGNGQVRSVIDNIG